MQNQYQILSENNTSTVIAHYERQNLVEDEGYQTEADLERSLIEQLKRQGYEYVPIHNESELIANLRTKIEELNNFHFTDNEWNRFFKTEIAAEGKGIVDKTHTIQTDFVKTLKCDNGEQRNIYLIKKDDIHANRTQVINQYEVSNGKRPNRYDVSILVNGLPLVHIELKKRGVSIKEAFNQINRYGRESFWAGNGLFEYVQIFVVSNGTQTKYYSNTTRDSHINEISKSGNKNRPKTSNSFEFTSYWADASNKVLNDLVDFTATFFTRHTLLNVLTRFCVLTEQDLLLVMRPYQIAATETLLNKIECAYNARKQGTIDACGYVWHTTGSGKTLTSFKAAQLATKYEFIDKVIFVVDRKDLDYQTMKEYDRFQKGAANGNTSTKILETQLKDPKCKIIITTIQKLTSLIKRFPTHEIFDKNVVLIFDECHRSQFGDMHTAIIKKFKKYYIFGFTGTPIFAVNVTGNKGNLRTTDDVFGKRLHTYTIVDAIRDHNVLPFRVTYISTMKSKRDIENSKVWDIEREKALKSEKRIGNVTQYILEHFAQQTKQASSYIFKQLEDVSDVVRHYGDKDYEEVRKKAKLNGFNSIFAVQSIETAKLYYNEFKKQIATLPENKKLKIATIFSYGVNDEAGDEIEDENSDSTIDMDECSRDFLEHAIEDYNNMFSTNYDTSAIKFPNYYKDVSLRMKNREIDILIVVNMFLTGFDATTLNTLWVDKNLRFHGLLQSYSRTNRILNSIKNAGNIVCFRNLEEQTNNALSLFGDADANGTAILRPFEDYFKGYTDKKGKHVKGYEEFVEELKKMLLPGAIPVGEQKERDFIKLFGTVLRFINMLSCFDQFAELNPLSAREIQDYTSIYIDLHDKYRAQSSGEKTNVNDDIEFEMEFVKQVEVNIDYILYLVKKYHESHCQNSEIRVNIVKSIESSPDLRDKKELIERFIDSMTASGDVYEEWQKYINEQKKSEFSELITEENLKKDKALEFIEMAFTRGYVPEGGVELNDIMPPINPFDPKANRQGKVEHILDRLKAFFTKYFGFANGKFKE
ncbi:MAG: type I restriction endonuclease subunit R [Paludibacteraceae bacterium]|nr:type I restriction endonuclease subunit R [Paludibacteraceae bacterium]